MDFKQLVCPLCNGVFNKLGRTPRIVTMCGHTYCHGCLQQRVERENAKDEQSVLIFECPQDGIKSEIEQIEDFPPNLALIKIIEKEMKENPKDMCVIHKKKLEVICVTCKEKVCPNCALFGVHNTHDIRPEEDVVQMITQRLEGLIEVFNSVNQERCILDNAVGRKQQQNSLETLHSKFRSKQVELIQTVESRFKELKQAVKAREKVILEAIQQQFRIVENKFTTEREENSHIETQLKVWNDKQARRTAQTLDQIDPLTMNEIPYAMIQSSENEEDLLKTGQKIQQELEHKKKQPPILATLDKMISMLSVEFNQEISKALVQFCIIPIVHQEASYIDFTALSGGTAPTAATMTTTFLEHQNTDFNPLNLAVDIVGEEENDFLLAGSLNVGRPAAEEHEDGTDHQNEALLQPPQRPGMLSQSHSIEELAKKVETATKGSIQKGQMKKVPSGSLQDPKTRRTSGIPPPGTKRVSSKPPGQRSSNFKPGDQERKEGEESVSDKTFNSHSDSALSKFEKILIEMEQEASDTYDFSGIDLREQNIELLCGMLSRSKQLRTLILSDCKIYDEICGVVLSALQDSDALKILNLQHNSISEESTEALTGLLKRLASKTKESGLKTLILSNNAFKTKLIRNKLRLASKTTNVLI